MSTFIMMMVVFLALVLLRDNFFAKLGQNF